MRSGKFKRLQAIFLKMKYKLPKVDTKMTFIILHFYLLVIKKSTLIRATQSEPL